MKTEQERIEQIEKMAQAMCVFYDENKHCVARDDTLCSEVKCQCCGYKESAKRLICAGYGDISEYKDEIERLRQEVRDTDKMARNTIEQYRAENEELENALKQSEDNYSRAYERLKAQGREIGKLKDENEALKNDLINSEGNLNHITTEIERLKEEMSNIRKETAKEIYEKTKEKDSYLLVWEYGEGYLDCLKNLGEVISEYGVEV